MENRWSPEGCYLDHRRSNVTHAVCVCSHMTNFAILMDVFEIQVRIIKIFVQLELLPYIQNSNEIKMYMRNVMCTKNPFFTLFSS